MTKVITDLSDLKKIFDGTPDPYETPEKPKTTDDKKVEYQRPKPKKKQTER